jgi:hypothetical protein
MRACTWRREREREREREQMCMFVRMRGEHVSDRTNKGGQILQSWKATPSPMTDD